MQVKNYILENEIGAGSFSTVYKAYNKDDGNMYAIKSMREMPRNNEEVVQNQIDLLKKVQHRNIVAYVTDFKEKGKWYIVFEYCGKGDLRKFKQKQDRLPEMFCKNLAFSMVSVLKLLHENNIVHRDLKLENVLINDNFDFKLADFGFSKDNQSELMVSFCGTPSAMAPQILRREPYDDRCDTWSLGIMLYEMIYGKLPFVPNKKYGMGIYGLTNCVLESEPSYDKKDFQISEQCISFIKLCLKKDKKDRPRMEKLINHPWISNNQSKLGKDFMKDLMQDKTEIINRMKQVFHGAIQQHIKKIIVWFNLQDSEIRKNLINFDKYFPEQKNVKLYMILMLVNIMKQIFQSHVAIQIQGATFKVPLSKINSFSGHFNNLKELLAQNTPKDEKCESQADILRKLIFFTAKEAQSCLGLAQNYPDKNNLLLYISKLPIYRFRPSKIKIEWSFNEQSMKNRMIFAKNLQNLGEEEIIKFANEHYADEDIKSNWIIQHEKNDERREGSQVEIGEFVSRIISINLTRDYSLA